MLARSPDDRRPRHPIDKYGNYFLIGLISLVVTSCVGFLMLSMSGWPPLPCAPVSQSELPGKYYRQTDEGSSNLVLGEDATLQETFTFKLVHNSEGGVRRFPAAYTTSGNWSLVPDNQKTIVRLHNVFVDPWDQPPRAFDRELQACQRDGAIFLQWDNPDTGTEFLKRIDHQNAPRYRP